MAFLLPNFVVNVLAGSINAAFIPTFVSVREQRGLGPANRLLGSVMLATTVLLGIATLGLTAAAPMILRRLAPAFPAEKLTLTIHLYYWLTPIIIMQGAISVWSSVLNATEQFALAAFLPAVATLVALAFLLAGAGTFGIYSLAVGYSVGFALQMLALGWALARSGYAVWPQWSGWLLELGQVLGQYLPMIAGAFLMCGTSLVEQFMAASLPPGSVASLGYAARLTSLVNGICAMALGTAVLPHFSTMVARADWNAVRHTFRTYRWIIFFGGAGIAGLLLVGSPWIVRLLFRRGSFTSADVEVVSSLQRLYAIQLPFYACGIMLVRLISALKANHFLMWGSLGNLLINWLLNVELARHFGLRGVALANSLMYMLSFAYLSAVVWWLLLRRNSKLATA
jgi:putative peptidoglycan lipid II flippase